MPIEPIELLKLIGGILIITIPGYLWSFIFSKQLTRLERFVFGFIFGLGVFSCGTFVLSFFFTLQITQNFILILYACYAIPIFIIYGLSLYKFGLPKISLTQLKNKKYLLLLAILGFAFFMLFLPHLQNQYYLPFHVDEWIHWSYSQAVMESGSTAFTDPYVGTRTVGTPEIGFHIAIACLKWFSGSNLNTIFLFMPALIGIFVSLTAYNIGERSERKYGLEAAFLIAFIPTTVRFLGPSFFVPVTLGLLFIIVIIWLGQLKTLQGTLVISFFIWCLFIIHPTTAFAASLTMLLYAIFLVIHKEYKMSLFTLIFSVLPLLIAYFLSTRWDYLIDLFIEAVYGKEELLGLGKIWVTFEHLGIITWALFIIGTYYAFTKGKALKQTLTFSAITFIVIIGLYDRFGYGVPMIYDRAFLYLFLFVALVAAVALSELRHLVTTVSEKKQLLKKHKRVANHIGIVVPVVVCIILFVTAVPAHMDIPYYELIDENDYETCVWIQNNIDEYRDENHTYDTAAVDTIKASPFSAITGLYIFTSYMHPRYRVNFIDAMNEFLHNNCSDTSFLKRYKISVVYSECNNTNLTMIYKNVYLYPGLFES